MLFVDDRRAFFGDEQEQAFRSVIDICLIVFFDPMAVSRDFTMGQNRMRQLPLLLWQSLDSLNHHVTMSILHV